MSFNLTESAKWSQANQKIIGDLRTGVDKALAEAASRGYAAAPGDILATILFAGQAAKDKLVETNGKIYDERRKVIFEQDEFAMKMIVGLAKLGMELYRAELFNLLEIEQAQNIALRDRGNADVIAMNAEVDKRQVAIIQARAEAERRVTILRAQLVTAEEGTLVSETALIAAQLVTAEKKLEIIASIYEVLAAEELVLAAELGPGSGRRTSPGREAGVGGGQDGDGRLVRRKSQRQRSPGWRNYRRSAGEDCP